MGRCIAKQIKCSTLTGQLACLQDSLQDSCMFTKAECNYAQIEKETLPISFSCNRFNQYTFNKDVTVESNHKPLETIFF